MEEVLSRKPNHYQVNVMIIEGRHLAVMNTKTKVNVSIGKRKKSIHAKSHKTDSPYYNDFCVFNFYLPLNVLLEEMLTIRLYQKKLSIKKLVGSFNVELATVWEQPNHRFYHKWAVLSDPTQPAMGTKGFLKCDIGITTKGVSIKPVPENEDVNDPQENLLVPYGGIMDRHRARIVFSVFRADSFSPSLNKLNERKLVHPYIRITYGGLVKKTRIAKNKGSPVWNQELVFPDLFPPLSQNILVELCDTQKLPHKGSIGNTCLDIRNLYEDGINGFLPTFGPNFIYLYTPQKKFERHTNCCTVESNFTYTCRLLIALRTEASNYPEDVKVQKKVPKVLRVSPIPPLTEKSYFSYHKFILFATIFDVLLFDSKYYGQKLDIQLTMGPKHNKDEMNRLQKAKGEETEEKVESPGEEEKPTELNVDTACSKTPRYGCHVTADYSFITFSGKFPCVHVFGEWPDSLRRLYRSNVINKAVQSCTQKINKIKNELQFQGEMQQRESSKMLKDTLAELSKSCEAILRKTKFIKPEDTNLYRHRKRVYHKDIAEIMEKTKIASKKKALKAEDELRKISAHLARLTKYAQEPENSFPETEIWLLMNKRVIAQYRIRAEDIAFSANTRERGMMAGNPQSLLIQARSGKKLKAKLDVFVWFGLADDFVQCLEMLPEDYKVNHGACASAVEYKIPAEITYDEAHHFQCRIHIFQAKIFFGFDDTGLADPFIRAIILGQNKATKVRKETLSPIWDETLVFSFVTLYGPSRYIKNNPINIIIEVYDKERFGKSQLIGRSLVTPKVKLKDDKYVPPNFPPNLQWEEIKEGYREVGKVLIATELLEISENLKDLYSFSSSGNDGPLSIPPDIRPSIAKYRMEVLFWGVRILKKKRTIKNKVFVSMECGEKLIKSPVLHNVRHKRNFPVCVQCHTLDLPEELEYLPPIQWKIFHIGSFTRRRSYVATCIVPSARFFLLSFLSDTERLKEKEVHIQITEEREKKKKVKENIKKKKEKVIKRRKKWQWLLDKYYDFEKKLLCKMKFKKCEEWVQGPIPVAEEGEEKVCWWMKYYASHNREAYFPGVTTFKIYHEELEAQPEFTKFMDYITTFDMVIGQEKKKKGGIQVAKVKAALKFYKWPLENSKVVAQNKMHPNGGFLCSLPRNDPIKIVVRVYVICGKNLSSRDRYGKSDPYLVVKLGDQSISDRKQYVPKQLNPTFGKCFEFNGTFPQDYLLQIKVVDHDPSATDDLIGETSIDIENRYYSRHHATCGIANRFELKGINAWRDVIKPTDILKKMCKQLNLPPPVFEKNMVVIEDYSFRTKVPPSTTDKEEIQALSVLKRWHEMPIHGYHLVPEHIETRSLYHPKLPGVEQGKLEMWVDIFPADFSYMPPKVDITPPPPVSMELRAIVWNVEDVVLDDKTLLFRDKMSDIYVRGWILSLEEDMQKTDIHYRSLNGEGNFNWRFIFRFNYIQAERVIVFRKKRDAFDMHPEERKHECKLEIQIWDNDAFGDDYLGTLILELCSMPRGAKLANRCTLKMLAPNAAKINLFKIRRTRGWWPFRRLKVKQKRGNEFELTGKIDLELEILTAAEAIKSPAGKGREEPNALPAPKRPATSFSWMMSPVKAFRFIIWKKLSRFLIITALILIALFFVLTGLYALPNYVVKKMLRA